MYNYTLLCTISTRAQLLRRQHRKRTSKKSEMVTCRDTTQVARNMWVPLIWIKPWSRMWHTMLEWLVIYPLIKGALYLFNGWLIFEYIKRNYEIAWSIISGKQINYKLYIHYTVHWRQYTLNHTYQNSVHRKKAKREGLCEKCYCE